MYNALKINFFTYKRILRNSIIDAKKRFYDMYFNMYKSNMNKTWKMINETIKISKESEFPAEFIIDDRYKL